VIEAFRELSISERLRAQDGRPSNSSTGTNAFSRAFKRFMGISPGAARIGRPKLDTGAPIMTEPRFRKLEREPLLEAPLPAANPEVRLIRCARIRFASGQPTGLHRHPMSTCGVVTAGRFRFQIEGEAERELATGDAFFEPAGRTILKFDNASDAEPAEIVCFYLTDSPERAPIEMLEGGMDAQLGAS
jgi:quercetin dioxygenase-like cupin family protein